MTEHQEGPAQESGGSTDASQANGAGAKERPVTVLALDGGGMRGLYSATLLQTLADRFAEDRGVQALDVGRGFDVIVGTSTGGILATALAAGVPIEKIRGLYRDWGPQIFSQPFPTGKSVLSRARGVWWGLRNLCSPANRNGALRTALGAVLEDETVGQLYARRRIGLCVPATGLMGHSPRVFKTPHLRHKSRDNDISLVDVCMSTSAAPVFLPLASLNSARPTSAVYADGGLWANSPLLIGLIEGLAMADGEQAVHVLSIGTCPPNPGAAPLSRLERGILYWVGDGVRLLKLAMDSQARAAHFAANLLVAELDRLGKKVAILRCEEFAPSVEHVDLLQLDSASERALSMMEELGRHDGDETYRWRQDAKPPDGRRLTSMFQRMPETNHEAREASG